jgi:hypothetical protein
MLHWGVLCALVKILHAVVQVASLDFKWPKIVERPESTQTTNQRNSSKQRAELSPQRESDTKCNVDASISRSNIRSYLFLCLVWYSRCRQFLDSLESPNFTSLVSHRLRLACELPHGSPEHLHCILNQNI